LIIESLLIADFRMTIIDDGLPSATNQHSSINNHQRFNNTDRPIAIELNDETLR